MTQATLESRRSLNFRLATMVIGFMLNTGLMTGCGKAPSGPTLVKARGTVTLNGAPLAGARLFFHPQSGKSLDCLAVSDDAGTFELYAQGKSGAVPGTYKVTVQYFTKPDGTPFQLGLSDTEMGMDLDQFIAMGQVKLAIPPKYTNRDMTDLVVEVRPEGEQALQLAMLK